MNIAVVGLGIIGGSFCKAIKKYTDHRVIGINRTKSTAEKALKEGAIDEIGTHEIAFVFFKIDFYFFTFTAN